MKSTSIKLRLLKMKLLIVESPTKLKTIAEYLSKEFKILASYGHVMELPSKEGSVDPNNNFEMKYQISPRQMKNVTEIANNAQIADEIYLATDPDREGEAISASILEALKRKKVSLKGKKVCRVTFNQITKSAVLEAIRNPRELDHNLINAQKARLALDYLVGFNISPVLWKKLPGAKSAGRVQSVALRIICQREAEIESFKKEEYWTIDAKFNTKNNDEIDATLEAVDGKKLEKFDLNTKDKAESVLEAVLKSKFNVSDIIAKEVKRKPYAPFTTSTIQQDASTKLGFSPKKTMLLAQKLYEGVAINGETKGLITYMRTDSPAIATEAITEIRKFLENKLGSNYLSNKVNIYTSKTKNAQEAHEAIRPVDITITPEIASRHLEEEMAKLYTLIWKRAAASQMSEAIFQSTKLEIANTDHSLSFKANGSILTFDGYQKVYNYSESEDKILPQMMQGDGLDLQAATPNQHFTLPPPRYTEAGLVKKLEELGIGRPSTYASILAVLQEREYAKLQDKKLTPEERGRVVTAFLETFFPKYVEYDFTAKLEDDLDLISNGEGSKDDFLIGFWKDFIETVENSQEKSPLEVSKAIEEKLEQYFFKPGENGEITKSCPSCKSGTLNIKIGKFGPFLGCSEYPKCNYITNHAKETAGYEKEDAKVLGLNKDGNEIHLKKGPYGFYIEVADGSKKPKRASIPKTVNPSEFTLEKALALLIFPRIVGTHPEGGDITAGIGPYGPYISYNKKYFRLSDAGQATNITLEEALEKLEQSKNTQAKSKKK